MMKDRCKRLCAFVLLGLAAPLAGVHAEEGDYDAWQTGLNLLFPPRADNPVTPAQSDAARYPLIDNPPGFDDGFSPGAYGVWQTVQVDPSTGAACADGSPYKFFVNRAPNTSNMLLYMEPGGACWDYDSCVVGGGGVRSAINMHGIPDYYMSLAYADVDLSALGNALVTSLTHNLITPLIERVPPFLDFVKTQSWTLVYVPYCTGDVSGGDKVAVYTDENGGNPTVVHHNGVRNTRAVVAWLKNHLQRPAQLVLSGSSAGGVGSLIHYYPLRRDMAPNRGFLLADSGPLMSAPVGADPAQYPSVPLHEQIRQTWNTDALFSYLAAEVPGLDAADYGSAYAALANKLPGDRMGASHFWHDRNFSDYSYGRFYADSAGATGEARDALNLERWRIDTERLRATLSGLPNFGGYFPQYRALNESHCNLIVDLKNSDVQAQDLELKDFVDSILDGQGPVLHASETDDAADLAKSPNLLYELVNLVLGSSG